MAWSFTSNPFISMYGPLFLVVYYVLVIALWQLTKALLKNWPRLPKETLLPNANISPCFILTGLCTERWRTAAGHGSAVAKGLSGKR